MHAVTAVVANNYGWTIYDDDNAVRQEDKGWMKSAIVAVR